MRQTKQPRPLKPSKYDRILSLLIGMLLFTAIGAWIYLSAQGVFEKKARIGDTVSKDHFSLQVYQVMRAKTVGNVKAYNGFDLVGVELAVTVNSTSFTSPAEELNPNFAHLTYPDWKGSTISTTPPGDRTLFEKQMLKAGESERGWIIFQIADDVAGPLTLEYTPPREGKFLSTLKVLLQ
ncbi:MAG TPA: hypothetical protein VH186_10355 [Chloroflexia bacterium]|nr:hypothetical protein [Chloroflexia bacterium]